MTSSSMLNLSFGSRKEALKGGKPPNSITRLQEKAEPRAISSTPSSSSFRDYSQYSPSRYKAHSRDATPTGRPKDEVSGRYTNSGNTPRTSSNRSFTSRNRGEDDDLKTPDYWLKGYGMEPRNKSTPNSKSNESTPKSNRSYRSPHERDFKE